MGEGYPIIRYNLLGKFCKFSSNKPKLAYKGRTRLISAFWRFLLSSKTWTNLYFLSALWLLYFPSLNLNWLHICIISGYLLCMVRILSHTLPRLCRVGARQRNDNWRTVRQPTRQLLTLTCLKLQILSSSLISSSGPTGGPVIPTRNWSSPGSDRS